MKIKYWYMVGILFLLLFMTACSDSDEDTTEQSESNDEPITNEADEAIDVPENAVAIMNGVVLDEDDLAFYTLIDKIEIEAKRYFDLQDLSGSEKEERQAFWDDELAYLENPNVQLNNLLELQAMRALAEEKHYDFAHEKIRDEITGFHEKIADIPRVQELIEAYDRETFDRHMRDYMRTSMLRDKVVADLAHEVAVDNPDANEQEQNLILAQFYEDLFIDQMSDLEVEILMR